MKNLILIFCLLITIISRGQIPPTFVSNTNKKDSVTSIVFKQYANKFDFLLAYSEESGDWRQDFKIIGLKGDSCFLFRQSKEELKKGQFVTKTIIPCDSLKLLLFNLSQLNFWTLNKDSLNQISRNLPDSSKEIMEISDGTNYKFEAISKSAYRKIESYAPDQYIAEFPMMTQRKLFIECRKLFKQSTQYNPLALIEAVIIRDNQKAGLNIFNITDNFPGNRFPDDWVNYKDVEKLISLIGSEKKCSCIRNLNPLMSILSTHDYCNVGGYSILFINSYRRKSRINIGGSECPKTNKKEVEEILKWWKINQRK